MAQHDEDYPCLGTGVWRVVVGIAMVPDCGACDVRLRGLGAVTRWHGKVLDGCGVAAFAVAHVFYALLFWSGSDKIAVLPAIVIVAYAISTEFWLIPRTGSLRWAVRIYVLFIAAMALAALSTQSIAVIVGAILFLTSDSLIGRGKFLLGPDHPKGVTNDYLVWITYIAAQILFFLAYA